jgi:CRP-like cAMP-binding protein
MKILPDRHLRDQAERARRLSTSVSDERTCKLLRLLAEEYEASGDIPDLQSLFLRTMDHDLGTISPA